jgi:hypothetical protein
MFAELERPRPRPIAALYDQTLGQLGSAPNSDDLEAWIAEGRQWNLDESVAAALRV